MTTALTDTLRQVDLLSLKEVLEQQRARAFDVVADARAILVTSGSKGIGIKLAKMEPLINDSGVTNVNGLYYPTSVAVEGISSKLGIPLDYLRKMNTELPELAQDNVQAWLDKDDRKFLMRLFRSDDDHVGVLRAFLSDQYRVIDNFDVLLAVLDGMREAGIQNPVIDADLTERRMIVRVVVPEIAVYAEKLLENYRSPFDGTDVGRGWTPQRLREIAEAEGAGVSGAVVFAGFVVTNSEVGGGAFRVTPRIVVEACGNGLQLSAEGIAKNHLGGKLDAGIVKWSEKTLKANLDLVTSQTADAVTTFLDHDFVTKQVEELEKLSGAQLAQPQAVITEVSKKLGFSQAQADSIMDHFIRGGQNTTGGVMQAVTSAAQTISDGDAAFELERVGVAALQAANQVNRELARGVTY